MALTNPPSQSWTWTCIDCGIRGSLWKTESGVCGRRGLPVLKGLGRCCVCAEAQNWQGMDDCGCRTCHLRMGKPFPKHQGRYDKATLSVSPPPPVASCVPWRARAHPWSKKKGVPSHLTKAFKLAVFGFDGCLFRTPDRPSSWPFEAYREMPDSLGSKLMPKVPAADWFHQPAVVAATSAMADVDTVTALVCPRRSFLQARIVEILEGEGAQVSLDEAILMPTVGAWSTIPPRGAAQAMLTTGLGGGGG
mmetsp:Transcript_38476/g.75150  ORF Transcript_38476/g.75150 Transcript_38476/m.75150 type:complete len:249 (+) Transcript_38476:324-1070(+)